jgi:hypothetical protein
MYIYFQGTEFADDGIPFVTRFSLGNLGFSKSICKNSYTRTETSNILRCNKGEIQPFLYYGLIPEGSSIDPDFCGNP